MNQTNQRQELIKAESIADELFQAILEQKIILAGITEKEINAAVFDLAKEKFGIEKYWHKRIVRAGENTLHPYDENPPNLTVQEDDIVFLDFGPILEDWEADYGRTYVIGNDRDKTRLAEHVEKAWFDANSWFKKNLAATGAELYKYCVDLAQQYGWEFGGPIAGHIIGEFPHEKLEKEDKTNYIHPENHLPLSVKNKKGQSKNWIIEIHFVDQEKKIGGFFEQLAG
jgi:Xaa-Pro aminopeptidase